MSRSARRGEKCVNASERKLYVERAQSGFGGKVTVPELIRVLS